MDDDEKFWDDLAVAARAVEAERLSGGWWLRGPSRRAREAEMMDDSPGKQAARRKAMAADFDRLSEKRHLKAVGE